MSIQEIESAIERLSADDLAELMAWLREHSARVWDEQIERDLQSGRIDAMLDEVDEAYLERLARPVSRLAMPRPTQPEGGSG
jgi:hypothetical protein